MPCAWQPVSKADVRVGVLEIRMGRWALCRFRAGQIESLLGFEGFCCRVPFVG